MPYRASWRLVGKEDQLLDRGKMMVELPASSRCDGRSSRQNRVHLLADRLPDSLEVTEAISGSGLDWPPKQPWPPRGSVICLRPLQGTVPRLGPARGRFVSSGAARSLGLNCYSRRSSLLLSAELALCRPCVRQIDPRRRFCRRPTTPVEIIGTDNLGNLKGGDLCARLSSRPRS